MKIFLAGYNLDADVIESLKQNKENSSDATPEVLSASYARISRDPRPINELRASARLEVELARQSNQNIIFKMGHSSIAEHAVFNFDIIDVSRLALEEIEKFRLCSYTEKSQRYQKLDAVFLVPYEIKRSGFENLFIETIKRQNEFYNILITKGIEPEDARYITSLSSLGQVGMTLNARNLELLFRRFAANPLEEVRQIGIALYKEVKNIAPSIIKHTEPTLFEKYTYPNLKDWTDKNINRNPKKGKEEVLLISRDSDGDSKILAALLHTSSLMPYKQCLKQIKQMGESQKKDFIKNVFRNMEFFDPVVREFEFSDIIFEIVLSSACFGQLKRHRIATLTSQRYDPLFKITVPPKIKEAGLENAFIKTAKLTEKAYYKIYEKEKEAASYILTNAHKKRILFKCNIRELYHISRLREDKHAQWDIQDITKKMTNLAKKLMPISTLLIGGKDAYPEVYKKLFGTLPSASPKY